MESENYIIKQNGTQSEIEQYITWSEIYFYYLSQELPIIKPHQASAKHVGQLTKSQNSISMLLKNSYLYNKIRKVRLLEELCI